MTPPPASRDYVEIVKTTLLASFTQHYFGRIPVDEWTDTWSRILRLKIKVIHNLARYVQNEVETKGHDLNQVLQNIAFFAVVCRDYITRDNGQPIAR